LSGGLDTKDNYSKRDRKNVKKHCLNCKPSQNFRGLDQLSSIFWRRVKAVGNVGVMYPRLAFVGVDILTNFWFWGYDFGSRYARKPIKSSKDSDDNLVSQKL